MSFDRETRNILARMVNYCRRQLTEDVVNQLQSIYGLHPDGTELALARLNHLSPDQLASARDLRELLDYYAANISGKNEDKRRFAFERTVLEISFTILNRLAALRMCEERGLVIECIRQGMASDGFRLFEQVANGALGTPYETYHIFLENVFDEAALDLGILFDRFTPNSAVFPSERTLEEVLSELNKPELKELWKEDETIGWIYQYFNPREERRAMREASQAPRNSRELAVRNQFFTPRYVVEFLTDNTLGRTWYEMCQGKTALIERSRYLVRRPDEVFLDNPDSPEVKNALAWLAGEDVPKPVLWALARTVNGFKRTDPTDEDTEVWLDTMLQRLKTSEGIETSKTKELLDLLFLLCRRESYSDGVIEERSSEIDLVVDELQRRVEKSKAEDLDQEELLKQPVFIPYRAKKDPRDIKILDPACGSGHFLLYAFDLLETIYIEAWEDKELPASEATGRALHEDYKTLEELRQAVPELIIRWNLYGIDIDQRAAQIAALALWLRAQKSWQKLNLNAGQRPRITKTNIVTAEPMPGDDEMRKEFTGKLQPRVLGQIVDVVFEKMKLAGEAGSLLKIEEEISDVVAEAKKQWMKRPMLEQQRLFSTAFELKQGELKFDISEIPDEVFWEQAEDRILDALKRYAEETENGKAIRKRMFLEDAAKGFAFIDLCRNRYDVVLMNPPFGEPAKASKALLERSFQKTKNDIYAAFVERGLGMLNEGGMLGAITSRTGFFLSSFTKWREEILLGKAKITVFADLGHGVMDAAMVEAAAYCLEVNR